MWSADSSYGSGFVDVERGESVESRVAERVRIAGRDGGGDSAAGLGVSSAPRCMDAYENPIDLWIIDHSSWLIKIMREELGLTPNGVTVISIVFSVLALVSLWYGKWLGFVLFSLLAYWMDDLDGSMARRYKLTSDIGEILDHASDALYFVGIIVVLGVRYRAFSRLPVAMAVLILSALIPTLHVASGNRACGGQMGLMGWVGKLVCPDDESVCADLSLTLRWFGGAGYQLILYVLTLGIAMECKRRS
jgi:phosphatidylglycerophosphate synthase